MVMKALPKMFRSCERQQWLRAELRELPGHPFTCSRGSPMAQHCPLVATTSVKASSRPQSDQRKAILHFSLLFLLLFFCCWVCSMAAECLSSQRDAKELLQANMLSKAQPQQGHTTSHQADPCRNVISIFTVLGIGTHLCLFGDPSSSGDAQTAVTPDGA